MKPIEDLTHVILYAKGWYTPSKDRVEDVKKCLSLDDYSGEFFNLHSICTLLLHRLEYHIKPATLLDAISPYECWVRGYVTLDYNPFNDLRAITFTHLGATLDFCLHKLRFMENDKYILKGEPNYKVFKRPKHIKLKTIKEKFTK